MAHFTSAQPPIVVDGATGYVGSHLVAALASSGYQVRCIVHPGSKQKDIDFLKSSGAEVYIANLHDETLVSKALTEAKVAVHLIGSIAPKRSERLIDLHAGQTQCLIKSCLKNGIEKIVMVTALGTAAGATSKYHATKWLAEECLRSSGLNHVILRPSLLLGRQSGHRDSKLVHRLSELIANKKMVPLISGGSNRIQPLFIGDLIKALILSIRCDDFVGQTFELGGPEILTMHEFVGKLMQALEVHKPIVTLAPGLARVIAFMCESIQTTPLISQDQVTLSGLDNVCLKNATETVFGITPKNIAEALETYRHSQPAMEPA